MNPESLQELADRVVAMARPGEQVEAVVGWSRDTEVRAYEGEVEHFVSADSAGVGIRVISEGRQGLSWAGVLDESALAECLAEARDNATFGSVDPDAGLAEPDGVEPVELQLYDERLLGVSTDDKIRLAIEMEALVRAGDDRISGVESADYADSVSATAIASTTGIRSAGAETSVYVGTYALAADDHDTTTGFGFSVGRSVEDLDVRAAADEAIERCVRLLGARKAPSERLTVVLHPYVTSQFLGLVAEMLSGEAVLRGRSPFAGRVGETVASSALTVFDDATDPAAPTASDTDGEGLACRRVPLIAEGVLQGYLHNAYTARASGTRSTGSAQRGSPRSAPGVGPHVVSIVPGASSMEQVLASVGDGLLVHEIAGLHSGVNPVSGDLSVGAEGLRIRGGELAEGVREVTIGSTLQRMLGDVVAVGNDLTYFPWESVGVTLAIADVTMSGH
ncbi:MAG: TldD/PmbA family protein [Microthrixaceae bacterium]